MNIPPILERLLLSNEAVFKNASLGLSGQNMVYVPTGKTAVILEFSVEPFCNSISSLFEKLVGSGVDATTSYITQFVAVREKLCYQLQIINDNYATYFSFHDSFSLVGNHQNTPVDYTGTLNLQFTGKREELFIYTDRSIYFNFIYPVQLDDIAGNTTGLIPNYGTPSADFLAKIQDLPENPTTFKNNANVDFVKNVQVNNPALDDFYPVNHQINGTEFPQMEYFRNFIGVNESTIQQPKATGVELQFSDLFKIPLLNVKYALINKRASDYGIAAPKNL
jgi:hypothetical protein